MILNSVDDREAEEYGTEIFIENYSKRSTDTPRREHPSAEQRAIEIENGAYESDPDAVPSCSSSSEIIDFSPAEEELSSAPDAELVSWFEEEPGEIAGEGSLTEHEDTPFDASPPDEADPLDQLTSVQNEVLRLIGKEGIQFDLLCEKLGHPTGTLIAACTMLELNGLVAREFGSKYVPVETITPERGTKLAHKSPLPATSLTANYQTTAPPMVRSGARTELSQLQQQVADAFIEYVRTYHHGISRKHVQLYFVRFWYYQSREHLPELWLSNACLSIADYVEKRVRKYTSPLRIKIPALLTQ